MVDDPDYVTKNEQVRAGLTVRGAVWAWGTDHANNWHPLTWLSLMLDTELMGTQPRGYHTTNLLLHLGNVLLLYAILRSSTGEAWRSALVAALFAVHPLHVESVAWVSERKDVLSTFFGFLAIWAFARYAARPGLFRYLAVFVCLALSLLAKPMLVTLPCLLLLLDYWPLRRYQGGLDGLGQAAPPLTLPRALIEKVPLFALAAASSLMTVWAQRSAMASLTALPLLARMNNALVSYLQYLRQTVLPYDLAPFYPYPRHPVSPAMALVAAFLLLAVTVLTLLARRRWPYMPVAWLWYLIAVVPVIGIVQVGMQSRADRYTYVPLVGIFILLVWGLGDVADRLRSEGLALLVGAGVLALLGVLCWAQAESWQVSFIVWDPW
jgi:hypothetical protein